MTERLSALMHDEADTLDVPALDHASIIDRGRRARTKHRATLLVGAAAALAVVGGGTALAVNGIGSDEPGVTDAATATPGTMSYAAGSTVVVDENTATVPDTVHSLHYTSAGVLVRSNPNDGASDGSGPESLTLVATDGGTTDLGTIPEGVGPATDPDEPVYALAERSGDGFRAVVRDARTGDEVGSVALPHLPMSYWEVPPLALDGDILYAGFKKEAVAFDWRTGERQPAAGLRGGIPEVAGGHALVQGPDRLSVVDAATGDPVLEFPVSDDSFGAASLSPDGRYLSYVTHDPLASAEDPQAPLEIHDLATGRTVDLTGDAGFDPGWTTHGHPFFVDGRQVSVCDPTTGKCTTQDGPGVGDDLRLGGNTYES